MTGRSAQQFIQMMAQEAEKARKKMGELTAQLNEVRQSSAYKNDDAATLKRAVALEKEIAMRKEQASMYEAASKSTVRNINQMANAMDNLSKMSLKQIKQALKEADLMLMNLGKDFEKDQAVLTKWGQLVKELEAQSKSLSKGVLKPVEQARQALQNFGKSVGDIKNLGNVMTAQLPVFEKMSGGMNKWRQAVSLTDKGYLTFGDDYLKVSTQIRQQLSMTDKASEQYKRLSAAFKSFGSQTISGDITKKMRAGLEAALNVMDDGNRRAKAFTSAIYNINNAGQTIEATFGKIRGGNLFAKMNKELEDMTKRLWKMRAAGQGDTDPFRNLLESAKQLRTGIQSMSKGFVAKDMFPGIAQAERELQGFRQQLDAMRNAGTTSGAAFDELTAKIKLYEDNILKMKSGAVIDGTFSTLRKAMKEQETVIEANNKRYTEWKTLLADINSGAFPVEKVGQLTRALVEQSFMVQQDKEQWKSYSEVLGQVMSRSMTPESLRSIIDSLKAQLPALEENSARWREVNQLITDLTAREKMLTQAMGADMQNMSALSVPALEAIRKELRGIISDGSASRDVIADAMHRMGAVTNELIAKYSSIVQNPVGFGSAMVNVAMTGLKQIGGELDREDNRLVQINALLQEGQRLMVQMGQGDAFARLNQALRGIQPQFTTLYQNMEQSNVSLMAKIEKSAAKVDDLRNRLALAKQAEQQLIQERLNAANSGGAAGLQAFDDSAQGKALRALQGYQTASGEQVTGMVQRLESALNQAQASFDKFSGTVEHNKAKLNEMRTAYDDVASVAKMTDAELKQQEQIWKQQAAALERDTTKVKEYETALQNLNAIQSQQKTNAMSTLGLTANGSSFDVGTTGMLAQLNDDKFPKTIEWLNKLKQEVEAFKTKFVTTPEGVEVLNAELEKANTQLQTLGAVASSTGQQNLFTLKETSQKMGEILANMAARKHPFVGDSGEIEKMNASLKKLRDSLIKNGESTKDVDRAIRGMKQAIDTSKISLDEFDRILYYPKGENNIEKINYVLGVLRERTLEAGKATATQAAQMRALDKQAKELNKTFGYHASTLENAASRLKSYVMIYMGFNALMMKARQAMSANLELADSISNVQKVSMLERQEVEKLSVALQDLNTRVGQSELMQLAYQGSKMGVASNGGVVALQQFVESANKLNSALGEDFGGTEAIGALTKLAQVMHITGVNNSQLSEGLERTGSAILRLGNTSTASYSYIQQFASRLGGIANLAHIAMPDLLAIGSTLDTMQMPAEMAATSMTKFISTMSKNPGKIEKALGISDGTLQKLVDAHRTMDAITLVFGTLNEKKADLADMANVLKDLVGGGNNTRSLQVLSSMANGYETLIEHLHTSNEAFEEATAVQREYNLMNENAAGYAKRAGNAIAEMFVKVGSSNAIGGMMKTMATFFEYLQRNGTMLLGIIGAIMARMGMWGKLWVELKASAMAYSLDRVKQLEDERLALERNRTVLTRYSYTMGMVANKFKMFGVTMVGVADSVFTQIKAMASAAWWIVVFEIISGIVQRSRELAAAQKAIYGAQADMNLATNNTLQRVTYLRQTLALLNKELRDHGVSVAEAVNSEGELTKEATKQRKELVKNARELERQNIALNKMPSALERATGETKRITNAVVDEKDATEETKKKVDEYNEAHKALWGYLDKNFNIQDLYIQGIINERGEIINLAGAYELLRQKIEASNQAKYANEQHESNRADYDKAISDTFVSMRKFLEGRWNEMTDDQKRSGQFSVDKVIRDWKVSAQKNIDAINATRAEMAVLLRENNMLSPAQLLEYSGDDQNILDAKQKMIQLDHQRKKQESAPVDVPQSYIDFLAGTPNQGMVGVGVTLGGMVKYVTRGVGNWVNGEDFNFENRNLQMGAISNDDRDVWSGRMQANIADTQEMFYRAEELTDTVLGIYDPVNQTMQEIIDNLNSDLNGGNDNGGSMTDISQKVIAKVKDAVKDTQEQTGRMFDDVIAVLNEQAKNGSLDADHLETQVKDYTQQRELALEAVNRFVHREDGAINPIMDIFTEEQLAAWEKEAIETKNETMRRAVAQLRQNRTLAFQNANLANTGMTGANDMGVVPKTKYNKKGEVSSQEYIDWENVRKAVVEMGEELDLKIAESLRKQAAVDGDRAKKIRAAILEGAPLAKVSNEFYKMLADMDIFFNHAADRSEEAVAHRLSELNAFASRITAMTYEEFQEQLAVSRYYRDMDAAEQKVLYDKLLQYRDNYDEAVRKQAKKDLKLLNNRVESGEYYAQQLTSLRKYQAELEATGQKGSEAYLSVARAIEVVSKRQNMLVDGKQTTYQQRMKSLLESANRRVQMEEGVKNSGVNNGVQLGQAKLRAASADFAIAMEEYQIRREEANREIVAVLKEIEDAKAALDAAEKGTKEYEDAQVKMDAMQLKLKKAKIWEAEFMGDTYDKMLEKQRAVAEQEAEIQAERINNVHEFADSFRDVIEKFSMADIQARDAKAFELAELRAKKSLGLIEDYTRQRYLVIKKDGSWDEKLWTQEEAIINQRRIDAANQRREAVTEGLKNFGEKVGKTLRDAMNRQMELRDEEKKERERQKVIQDVQTEALAFQRNAEHNQTLFLKSELDSRLEYWEEYFRKINSMGAEGTITTSDGVQLSTGVKAGEMQKFATGGFIRGAVRDRNGDGVVVRVNAGEAVLTPEQQRAFMALANGQVDISDKSVVKMMKELKVDMMDMMQYVKDFKSGYMQLTTLMPEVAVTGKKSGLASLDGYGEFFIGDAYKEFENNRARVHSPNKTDKDKLYEYRKRLYYALYPTDYDVDKAIKAVRDAATPIGKGFRKSEGGMHEAAWALYMGIKPEDAYVDWTQKFAPADYTISKGKPVGKLYKITSDEWQTRLDNKRLLEILAAKDDIQQTDEWYHGILDMHHDYDTFLGAFTRGRGKDANGNYIFYYDEWDLNPFHGTAAASSFKKWLVETLSGEDVSNLGDLSQGVGIPFSLYDRRYYMPSDVMHALNDKWNANVLSNEDRERLIKKYSVLAEQEEQRRSAEWALQRAQEGLAELDRMMKKGKYVQYEGWANTEAEQRANYEDQLKFAKEELAKLPKFAGGGIADGPTSGDKTTIRVNGREMILTLEQQKRLLDIANGKNIDVSNNDYTILMQKLELTADGLMMVAQGLLSLEDLEDDIKKETEMREITVMPEPAPEPKPAPKNVSTLQSEAVAMVDEKTWATLWKGAFSSLNVDSVVFDAISSSTKKGAFGPLTDKEAWKSIGISLGTNMATAASGVLTQRLGEWLNKKVIPNWGEHALGAERKASGKVMDAELKQREKAATVARKRAEKEFGEGSTEAKQAEMAEAFAENYRTLHKKAMDKLIKEANDAQDAMKKSIGTDEYSARRTEYYQKANAKVDEQQITDQTMAALYDKYGDASGYTKYMAQRNAQQLVSDQGWQSLLGENGNGSLMGMNMGQEATLGDQLTGEAEQQKIAAYVAAWKAAYAEIGEAADKRVSDTLASDQTLTAEAKAQITQQTKDTKAAFASQQKAGEAKEKGLQVASMATAAVSSGVQDMVTQASGNAMLGQMAGTLAQVGGNVIAGIASGSAKTISEMGWWGMAFTPLIQTALMALLGLATSKMKKAQAEVSQATGVSSGRLTTSMLTYATGRYLDDEERLKKGRATSGMLTMSDGYQPGQSYSVDGSDGNTYSAKYEGAIKDTGIRKGTHFGIFSEVKPEMVIDGDTTALMHNKYPMIENAILQLHRTGTLNMGEMLGLDYASIGRTIDTLSRSGSLSFPGGMRMPTFAQGNYPYAAADGVDLLPIEGEAGRGSFSSQPGDILLTTRRHPPHNPATFSSRCILHPPHYQPLTSLYNR